MSIGNSEDEAPPSIQAKGESLSDVEKITAEDPAVPEYQRQISTLQWTLVCVGLFLGAILYGKYLLNASMLCESDC
tara:strand:+ start:97 stop:324 length:228 start_codon:yes stop_codon:yes gene_type:complete